jgi:hypothetical protein
MDHYSNFAQTCPVGGGPQEILGVVLKKPDYKVKNNNKLFGVIFRLVFSWIATTCNKREPALGAEPELRPYPS